MKSGRFDGVAKLIIAVTDGSFFTSTVGCWYLGFLWEVVKIDTGSGGVLVEEDLVDRADCEVSLLKAGEHLSLEEGWLDNRSSCLELSSLEGRKVAT